MNLISQSEFYYLYYPIILIIFLVVVYQYRKILLTKQSIFVYGNFAALALFILWLGIAFATTDYSVPWYALHTITGHHFYDIIFCFCLSFFYIWIKKGYRPLWSLIIVAFPIAINEWAWWVVYYIYHYITNNPDFYLLPGTLAKYTQQQALQNMTIYNFTGWAYIIIIALFLYKVKLMNPITKYVITNKQETEQETTVKIHFGWILWFTSVIVIYYAWYSLGFHITIDFSGVTVYFLDFQTNMIENLHWIIPTALMLWWFDLLFAQNSTLKGMPPLFFRLYFQGKIPDSDVKTIESFFRDHPHYNQKMHQCDNHISCMSYDQIPEVLT